MLVILAPAGVFLGEEASFFLICQGQIDFFNHVKGHQNS
jgi:hypothetical protein